MGGFEMEIEEVYKIISDTCNTMNLRELRELGKKLAEMHPTLQQNFMRVVTAFIEAQSKKVTEGYYDDRNRATVELASLAMSRWKDSRYCYDGEIHLPFI